VSVKATFTLEERNRIDGAIASLEHNTATDLGLVVTRVSDRYAFYPLIWAGFIALVVMASIALLRPELHDRFTIVIELTILLVLTLLFDWLPIRLALVPRRVKHAYARQLAHREFAAHGANGDRHRRRILLFVSLGECYVEAIADHATHAIVPGSIWDKIVADFATAIKDGRLAAGAVAAIESFEAALERPSREPSIDRL
jgi:putative membrane protein